MGERIKPASTKFVFKLEDVFDVLGILDEDLPECVVDIDVEGDEVSITVTQG